MIKEENWQEVWAYLKKPGSNRILRARTVTVSFGKSASLSAETVLDVQRTTSVIRNGLQDGGGGGS